MTKLKAELISEDASYPGFIENFLNNDVYISTTPSMSETDSTPGNSFTLKFTNSSGRILNLNCKIKWSYKTPPVGMTNIIAEILDPLAEKMKISKILQ